MNKSSKKMVLHKISYSELANGVILCLNNAFELLKLSSAMELLNKTDRSNIFLIAAIEEMSKVQLIFEISASIYISPEAEEIAFKKFIYRFKNHKEKQSKFFDKYGPDIKIEDKNDIIEFHNKYQNPTEQTRLNSMYVNFSSKLCKFESPENLLSKKNYFNKNRYKISSDVLKDLQSIAKKVKNKKNCEIELIKFNKLFLYEWKKMNYKLLLKGRKMNIVELKRYLINSNKEKKIKKDKKSIDYTVSLLINLAISNAVTKYKIGTAIHLD